MYRFYDEKKKIREIQRYLFVTESGNYDERTREAVVSLQGRNGIEENGKIDYETFNLIYREYAKKKETQILRERFSSTYFPIKINSYSEAAMEVNKMLLVLSAFYGIQTNLKYSDYYGERTERILRELSEIYGVERTVGEIDGELYRLLETDFCIIKARGD